MDPDPRGDAELVAELPGEPGVLGPLYERHAGAVYRYLVRRAGVSAAEDLLGEVFVVALGTRHRVVAHRSGSALPWLYGIAGNVVRGHVRRTARQAPVPAELSMDWDDVDDRIDAQAQRRELDRALQGLSVVERDLLLVAWEGLTAAEAGAALGISAVAARSRLHRARRHAEQALTVCPPPIPPAVTATPHPARAGYRLDQGDQS